jgi:hypothetical protein
MIIGRRTANGNTVPTIARPPHVPCKLSKYQTLCSAVRWQCLLLGSSVQDTAASGAVNVSSISRH